MTLPRQHAIALLAAFWAGCASAPTVDTLRFQNREPVRQVNDQKDTPKKPSEQPFPEKLYFFDAILYGRLLHMAEQHPPSRAANINSLGEVPDSTWFTNRVGMRDLTPDEIKRGPNAFLEPDRSQPWQVTSSKVGGGSKGFIIKDARGDRYIVKFDEKHSPTMESATDVAVQRLIWACGYNVPENSIVYFKRKQLRLAADASVKDVFGNKTPMTVGDLDGILEQVSVRQDGTYRALVSKYLPGVPIGGFSQEGTRPGDPNDVIPHQHRREVRGLYVFFSWLQQTDVKQDNTADMWQADPNTGRNFVRHYLARLRQVLWYERVHRAASGRWPR